MRPILLLLLIGVTVQQAAALSCSLDPDPRPCFLWETQIIFLGTVLSKGTENLGEGHSIETWRVRVDESFRGTKEGDVMSVASGAWEQVSLKIGTQYLVRASRFSPNYVNVADCLPPINVEEAAAVLSQFRAMKNHKRPASLFGMLWFRPAAGAPPDEKPVPATDIRIQVKSGDKVITTATNAQGSFAFPRLEPGRYEVLAEPGSRVALLDVFLEKSPEGFELGKKACGQLNLYVAPLPDEIKSR